MYLKEIKISGFKSFADKININLDDDITCIVGPNGSGKSNIVDAVRWVLGEQSVKSLRGSNNMTDVIFSGSKSRNPLNLASVTLVFDNSDSYLKVPYTEISVTRKVYRSGENEYLINNEKCRLKDISDLFLDSGMGKYAFNIISQGEVGKIISDSPYERRVIFEEAAGVLKYKKRKEEALKKLDRTNDNLIRVKDIIGELNEQIDPLREQSEAAKDYLDAKKRLEDIEIALIANDLEKYNLSYQKGLKNIESIQNEIALLGSKNANSSVDIESKKTDLNEINYKIVDLNNKYISLTKEEEKLNGEKNIIKERSKYDSENVKVHENIVNLKEKKLSINNKLLSLRTDKDILENKINDINIKINDCNKKLNVLNSENNKLFNLSNLKRGNASDLDVKIKSLSNYIEQGGNTPISVKKVLSNPKLKGLHNTISRLVEIDDEYLVAFNVALGGAKDYVVVDNPNVAKNAIDYLKENNLGRVTFFPLDVIKPRYIDDEFINILKKCEGFIDVLANKISYDNKYRNIVFNQLGNVVLVSDIDSANVISKKINNKYKIVTLSGEVINVGGSITGGSIKNKSVISEKYELNSLISEREGIIEEIKNIEDKKQKIIEEIKELQGSLFDIEKEKLLLNEELSVKREVFNSTKKEFENIDLELSNLNDLVNDNLKDEEDRVLNKYYEVLNKKEELEKEIEVVNKTKDSITNEIEQIEANLKVFNSEIREKENVLKELEINNTKLSVKMDNLLDILSETYSMTFEKAKANYILEIDEDIARKSVNELKNRIKKIGNVNIGAIEEFERVSVRYDFLLKQSKDLESASLKLLEIIDELDQVMKDSFVKTYKQIELEFNNVFRELFGGGSAKLQLTDKDNILETGVDIVVTPPGKKVSTISLLSGGEKTLTAISLLFAILNIKKIPFCLFDEVEAALDEANVDRVGAYFKKYINKTQLIIITHKKKTMEYAKTLYGITMQESGVSKLVSVKLVN